jgi:hypothetical protein
MMCPRVPMISEARTQSVWQALPGSVEKNRRTIFLIAAIKFRSFGRLAIRPWPLSDSIRSRNAAPSSSRTGGAGPQRGA